MRALLLVGVCVTLIACSGGEKITPVQTAYNRGVAFYTAGDYHRAIHEFREAIRNDPDDIRARFNLALSMDTLARNTPEPEAQALAEQAVEQYHTLLERDPGNVSARINLAVIASERGRVGEAVAELERIINDNPRRVAPRAALASLHLRAGDAETARRVVVDARRLDPASPRLWFLLGQCDEALGDDVAASKAYTAVMRTDSDDLAALLALARIQLRLEQPGPAWANAKRVLFIDQDNWQAQLIASDAALLQDRLNAAAYHLARAKALDHQRPSGAQPIDYDTRLVRLYRRLADQLEAPDDPAGS